MIAERLRFLFAEERRPLLFRSLVFGFALLLILPLRTGLLDLLAISFRVPSLTGPAAVFILLFWISLFSLPLILLFVVWSLLGLKDIGLPRRSIGASCLLVTYQPFRYYKGTPGS